MNHHVKIYVLKMMKQFTKVMKSLSGVTTSKCGSLKRKTENQKDKSEQRFSRYKDGGPIDSKSLSAAEHRTHTRVNTYAYTRAIAWMMSGRAYS